MPLSRGSTVALITPFLPNTMEVDYQSLEKLLQYHLDSGTSNLCMLGTTGEASVLSMDERKKIIETSVKMCKGKLPILVGVGTINPETVKSNIYQAQDLGADAVMVVTPYYVKPPQRGLVRFFTSMAACGMPTVLYNVPGRTASDCLPETIYECCRLSPNIVGVKEATGDISRVKKLRTLFSDVETGEKMNVLLFSGDDSTSVDFCLEVSCMSVSLWYFISIYIM
jgi:4-hydroxy-tetrahydrodipicolinate synthase